MPAETTPRTGNRQLTLVIANKNYSSWSLRAWLAMRQLGIPFAERLVKFDSAAWVRDMPALSPTGLVPVLWEGEPGAGFATFDTSAIFERLHELHPSAGVWPADPRARARARSLVAEFHAGFGALRTRMPMNIRSRHPGKGMDAAVAQEIERLCRRWQETRATFGGEGPFLFGAFCAADASYTPVASRFATYGVALPDDARAYQQALLATPAMRDWTAAALRETEFVAMDEPYATPPRPGSTRPPA